jgi:2'-5' RNA ligase
MSTNIITISRFMQAGGTSPNSRTQNRIFIGVPVPSEAALQLQAMLPQNGFLRQSLPENYHITLLFLGAVSNLQNIVERFESIRFEPFTIAVDGIGGFYKKDRLRIIYLSISEGSDQLGAFSRQVKSMFPEFVNDPSSDFVPHITLCRNLKEADREQAEALLSFKFSSPITFEVHQLFLYDSGSFSLTKLYRKVSSVSVARTF